MPNPRKLLFPFSVIYDGVTRLRNKLFDLDILKSTSYELPVIAVGNLNMGGTGKSPMVEYLLKELGSKYKVASLSRGYKRESKGFHLVEKTDSASQTGDEPLQFKNKFPEALIAVDANRREGIAELMKFSPDIILLDDAFQHRKVQAGFYILLTAYNDLYVDDLVLPGGNLRESASGAGRAQAIVVTKCPPDLSENRMAEIKQKLNPSAGQSVFFTSIKYSNKIYSSSEEKSINEIGDDFSLVTGIANPRPLLEFLKSSNIELKHFKFPDHHNFSKNELESLRNEDKILTTEKDYMRLRNKLQRLYYLPIEVEFLNNAKDLFNQEIEEFLQKKEV